MTAEERLEAIRVKLCSAGLNRGFYDTPEKAVEGCLSVIEALRRESSDPPHHMQCAVLRKLRVYGFMEEGDPEADKRLVDIGADTTKEQVMKWMTASDDDLKKELGESVTPAEVATLRAVLRLIVIAPTSGTCT